MTMTQKRIKDKKRKEKSKERKVKKELDNRKVIGYVRVSTEKQKDQGYGLEYQTEKVKDYCKRNTLKLSNLYQDSFSGKTNDREDFKKLETEIRNNKVKTLITYKLDRLGRSQLNILNFIQFLQEFKVKLITLDPEIDYTTSSGKILLSNLSMFSEIERDLIIERTDNGRIQKFSQGLKCQGSILGYNHNKKTKKYEVVSEEKELVIKIFRDYLKVKSLSVLMKDLNEQGIRTKRGNQFSRQSLHVILTNHFYTGSVFYKKKELKGRHETTINKVLFGRVQSKLERNKRN